MAETPAAAAVFEDAALALGGHVVWQDVNVSVAVGEFVAVLGPNGAGKSTLLKALLGVAPLSRGKVSVFGRPVTRGNDQVGYLPQRRRFDPDLRIRAADLVRLGLDGARWGLPLPARLQGPASRAKSARVAEVIDLVGAGHLADRPIGELSGGEQQRILIAQALVGGARMLVLDEPLDSLDLHNQQAISALIQKICRERDVTVLLVAHDVNPILQFLDSVIYVANQRVVCGRPRDVIRTETLTRLYGTPVEVLETSDGRLVVVGHQETVSYHGHEH